MMGGARSDSAARPDSGRWRITRAGESDGWVMASIHAAALSDPWDAYTLTAFLGQPGGFALIADDGAGPSGFLLARAVAGESEVLTLAVRPDRRRGGCAAALLAKAMATAAELGARRMVLEVGADNLAARRLYAGARFRAVGRRRGYYRNAAGLPLDALLLTAAW